MLTLIDLRELPKGDTYLTQCNHCGFKGYLVAGYEDSVCPECESAVYALPKPHVWYPAIHRAVNHQEDAIAALSANPFTSAKKIENGMIVSVLQSLPSDASPEHRRDMIRYAQKQAKKIIREKNLE